MKTKYIIAIGALGSTLAIVPPCTAVSASPQIYPPMEAPAMPPSAVWDGSEYVGQVDGKYYYQGPNNTWRALDQDPTRQQRFEEWQKNRPTAQSSQTENTRSQGAAKGLNASEQTSQSQIQKTGYGGMGQGGSWNNPGGQSGQIRNTRYEGHDMGQTHPVAPPLETH